ncbi:SDR family NAD(P)-dependent oxidoreductase [Pantoea sp. App145]|uniref:SDR family NAD(P)-dependent oxidoreductase n=1 Tax=Pantoea sp. App145 TaxID=3071567 RepID=UPI003A80247B
MMTFDLQGKTALVTGGASGIGFEVARLMARSGATVAINFLPNDIRGEQALTTLQAEGLAVIGAPGDLADPIQAEAMVKQAVLALGHLDLLVNNAGTPGVTKPIPIQDLESVTEELWQTLLNVNLMSVFRCAKAAAASLKASHGAIVNTASIAGFGSIASTLAYSASKAGVINLTKNLAHALAPEVRVNAVAPGSVESSWAIEWSEERRRNTVAATPLQRWCTPDDVAELIVYLGFAGRMITGQTVIIDGGISI